MGIELASFESNEALLSRLPKFPVGFRGQAVEFNKKTLQVGLDTPREYFVINLTRLSLDDIKMGWKELRNQFNFSVKCGRTINQHSTRKDVTVQEAITYYIEHPVEYSSVLVLAFPKLTDWLQSHIKSKDAGYGWYKHKLSPRNIVGTVNSQKQDFLEFQEQLTLDQLLGKTFESMHQYLESRMMTRYLEFLAGLKSETNFSIIS